MKKFKKMGSEIGKPDGVLPFNCYVRSKQQHEFIIPVIGELESPEDFLEAVSLISQAEGQDTVILHINSCGGSLAAVDYLLDALSKTEAHVHAEVTGQCMSAATLILDHVDSFTISDSCEMLIHNQVFGTGGKHSDVVSYVTFADTQNKKLLERYYAGMFNEEEMRDLYNGRQFYLDNTEYLSRFNSRQSFLSIQSEAEEHECQCENCSCNEEDPVLRQIAEEMFDEAIPQKIYETIEHVRQNARGREIQWELQDDSLMAEQARTNLRDALNNARQNVYRGV